MFKSSGDDSNREVTAFWCEMCMQQHWEQSILCPSCFLFVLPLNTRRHVRPLWRYTLYLHCYTVAGSLFCFQKTNEGNILCQTHLKMFYSALQFSADFSLNAMLISLALPAEDGFGIFIFCLFFQLVKHVTLQQDKTDKAMCCAVGTSGYKRAHTELTLKWTPSVTHVEIQYTINTAVIFTYVTNFTANGQSLEVLVFKGLYHTSLKDI